MRELWKIPRYKINLLKINSTSLIYTELWSCHSQPHNKKKKAELKNKEFFVVSSESWSHTATCYKNIGEAEKYRITAYQEQKPISETNTSRNTNRKRKHARGWVWIRLRVKNSQRPPHFPEFFFQEPHEVFRVRIKEKSPQTLNIREVKVTILKYTKSVLFLAKACPQGKLFYQSLTNLGFTRA